MSEETTFDNLADDLFDTMAPDATFTPLVGNPVTGLNVSLVSEMDFQPGGYESSVHDVTKTVEYLFEDIGREAKRGEKFLIGSTTYTVEAVLENDLRFVKVSVK